MRSTVIANPFVNERANLASLAHERQEHPSGHGVAGSISGSTARTLTYTASGQAATDQRSALESWTYTTDKAGRMSTAVLNGVTQTTTAYDADELRIVNTNALTGHVTHYVYDAADQLIAEMDGATGNPIREYIWLGALPIGYVDRLGSGGASRLFYVHADHLARPQKITDASRAIVWDGVFAPFGEIHSITGSIVNVLMFPGQVYDPETGLAQNWHRDYDANIGRYLQSDPIGLEGGINTYAYVEGNPTAFADPDGRQAVPAPIPIGPPIIPQYIPGTPQHKQWKKDSDAIAKWLEGKLEDAYNACFREVDCGEEIKRCTKICIDEWVERQGPRRTKMSGGNAAIRRCIRECLVPTGCDKHF
jgi:RHS repeat-associated protein